MPLFRPRTRVEILREMIARVIARSSLVGLIRNSAVFHLLAAAADEDADQYYQLANLKLMFSIDTATGSDLDDRARDIQPSTITRRTSQFASGDVTFTRDGTVGTTDIAAGTIVAARDTAGQIKYRTTALAQITPGNSTVSGVTVVALEAGARGNADADTIVQLVSRIPGIISVTNPNDFTNGQDRESDDSFRARLKLHVQSLSNGTPTSVVSAALNAQLPDGRQAGFARVYEPVPPDGTYNLYVDDGTGTIEEYEETYLLADDIMIASAVGGETSAYTTNKPVRDDGSFQLWINSVLQTRDTDYWLNASTGQVELAVALTATDEVKARYRNYSGLIQEIQLVLNGIIGSIVYPGVRAGGIAAYVLPAQAVWQTITGNVSPKEGYLISTILEAAEEVVSLYINNLDIGEHVIVSEIIERVMGVEGVYDFRVDDLSGTAPPVNQIILFNQVARIATVDIGLT